MPFRDKARLVVGGNITKAPTSIMYAGVLIATLNLEVMLGDILNAYVWAPVTEKVWATLGSEFNRDATKTAVIV